MKFIIGADQGRGVLSESARPSTWVGVNWEGSGDRGAGWTSYLGVKLATYSV